MQNNLVGIVGARRLPPPHAPEVTLLFAPMPEPPLAEVLLTFARALRARHAALLAPHGLHPGQDAVLMVLWETPGLRPSALADRLGVEPPTITQMVHRLERGGLVDRRRDPDDARASLVYPTPRARLLEAMVRRAWGDLDAMVIAALGPGDADRLRTLVQLTLAEWQSPTE